MTVVVVGCAALGLLIGSFLNVVIWRVPRGESVVRPASACPACGAPLAARDNVPVLSWLLLRARARCCGARISARYPLVELATAGFFAGVAAWLGLSWALPAYLFLAAITVALTVIDIDALRLPFVIVAPAFIVAVVLLGGASLAAGDGASALRAVLGAAALWSFYRLLHAINPRGMGYGDVRLAGVLGLYLAWLGWGTLAVGAFLGFFTGGLGGIALMLLQRANLKSHIPYGPYLLLGAWLGMVAGPAIGSWYLDLVGLA